MTRLSEQICCGDSPELIHLYDHITVEGYKSWRDETFPDAHDEGCHHRYIHLSDWYLRDLRQQYPDDPYLYLEHVRRSPGHLEGSSKEGAVLDIPEYRHLVGYLRLPYDTCPLPPRDRNPFSKVDMAVLKRKLSSKEEEKSPNFLPSGGSPAKRSGFVRKSFSFLKPSSKKGQELHGKDAVDKLHESEQMRDSTSQADDTVKSSQEKEMTPAQKN